MKSFRDNASNPSRSRPAVFLDRDGTIIEDKGHLKDPEQVVFYKDTVPSLRKLQQHYDLFIVTNQGGVDQGLLSMQDVERVNGYVLDILRQGGVRIKAVYVCPHHRDTGCECIKPKPYFIRKAQREHGIDPACSFAVGDHPHDVQFAQSAGARGIYVLTGHGAKHRDELPDGTVIAAGIREACDIILE